MYVLPYLKIFKQALELTKTNKFLWIFGLFLVWGALLSNGVSLGLTQPEYQGLRQTVISWTQNHIQNNFLVALAALLTLVFLILYFRAKAGVIIAIKAILDKQETGFRKAFKFSNFFYFRVMGLQLAAGAVIFLAGALLAGPVMYLAAEGLDFRAGLLSLLALLIFVPISIIFSFVNSLGCIFIVAHDLKIGEAFNHGLGLSLKFWPTLLIFMVYMVLISVAGFIISATLAVSIGSVFVILSNLFYDNEGLGAIFINGVGSAIAAAIFLTIQSAVISFHHTAWVLAFRELVKPVKMEEDTAVVPEIAA